MPTKQEIARGYAGRIRAAMPRKVIAKTAQADLSEAVAAELSRIFAVARTIGEIVDEINELERNQKPLTQPEKDEISRAVGEELGLDRPEEFVGMTKSASNNAYMQLLIQVSGMIQNVKR